MKSNFINELSIPVVAAPLFLISCPELVIECCKKILSVKPDNYEVKDILTELEG